MKVKVVRQAPALLPASFEGRRAPAGALRRGRFVLAPTSWMQGVFPGSVSVSSSTMQQLPLQRARERQWLREARRASIPLLANVRVGQLALRGLLSCYEAACEQLVAIAHTHPHIMDSRGREHTSSRSLAASWRALSASACRRLTAAVWEARNVSISWFGQHVSDGEGVRAGKSE